MNYTINLSGLEVFAYHGVLEHEKAYGQSFFIDCRYQVAAGSEDELGQTVSYAEVADVLAVTAKSNTFDLLETLAAALLAAVMSLDSKVIACQITVHKPQAPIEHKFEDVSVSVQGGNFED
ncbi:MAG: dihydroneopterin aldolase [Actinomycetota bacterium]